MQLLSFFIFYALTISKSLAWTYSDSGAWIKDYPDCGGSFQSPVNFDRKKAIFLNNYPKLSLVEAEFKAKQDTVTLTDKTLQVKFSNKWVIKYANSGPVIQLDRLEFHWDNEIELSGSEHRIDGVRHALEAQFFGFNSDLCSSIADAQTKPSCAYHYSILYKKSSSGSTISSANPLKTILLMLASSKVMNEFATGNNVLVSALNITNMFPRDLNAFYTYKGSWTRPPCTENVVWTVFQKVEDLSIAELELFSKLTLNKKRIISNFRSAQPLNPSDAPLPRHFYMPCPDQ